MSSQWHDTGLVADLAVGTAKGAKGIAKRVAAAGANFTTAKAHSTDDDIVVGTLGHDRGMTRFSDTRSDRERQDTIGVRRQLVRDRAEAGLLANANHVVEIVRVALSLVARRVLLVIVEAFDDAVRTAVVLKTMGWSCKRQK